MKCGTLAYLQQIFPRRPWGFRAVIALFVEVLVLASNSLFVSLRYLEATAGPQGLVHFTGHRYYAPMTPMGSIYFCTCGLLCWLKKEAWSKARSSEPIRPVQPYEALSEEKAAVREYALRHPELRHRELAWRMVDGPPGRKIS